MSNEQHIYESLAAWANADDNIRAMLLTSSRTNPHAFNDDFSDYDVEVFVRDWEPFLATDAWLADFGDILVRWPRLPLIEDGTRVTRLVLFEDGFRIDFQIFPLATLHELAARPFLPPDYDYGYRVLLDKDGLTKGMVKPTHTSFLPTPPSEADFLDRVQGFLWDCSALGKSLWREEVTFVKFMLDGAIRTDSLEPLLGWYIGLLHNWSVYPNKHGRWFRRYLDPATWRELEATYTGADIAANWKALFTMMSLFRRLGEHIAHQLGFSYPVALHERVWAYLHIIRDSTR